MSVWRDAYYVSTREFGPGTLYGIGAYAVNRAQLLAGNPATQTISFLATDTVSGAENIGDGLLPSDIDGDRLPPFGSPAYFVGTMDDGGPYGATQDAITLWKFHADFTTPANSTFALTNTIPVAAFDSMFDAPNCPNTPSMYPAARDGQQDRHPVLSTTSDLPSRLPQLRHPRVAGDQPVG